MSEERPLVERAQRALRGEEPWEPIMDRIHTFVRGDLDAEIAALKDDLAEIAAIIESVDMRAAATDGPVTPTLQEMTQEEISRIYAIAAKRERRGK